MKRRCLLTWLLFALAGVQAAEKPIVQLGFYLPTVRDANLADIKVSLQVWAEEMGRPLGYQVQASTYEDMPALRGAMKRGELHIVNAAGMELAEMFSPDELQGGYAKRIHDTQEGLVLVANQASGIQSFADLRGKRLSYLSKDRLAEVFLETQCLKATGQNCKDVMVLTAEKRDIQSVYSVFFGKADAALVSFSTLHAAVELNPQVAQRLRVLLEWKTTALVFGMVTRQANPALRDVMFNATQEVFKSTRGRQMLEMFKTDYVEKVETSALNPFWDLLQEYRALEKARAMRKK